MRCPIKESRRKGKWTLVPIGKLIETILWTNGRTEKEPKKDRPAEGKPGERGPTLRAPSVQKEKKTGGGVKYNRWTEQAAINQRTKNSHLGTKLWAGPTKNEKKLFCSPTKHKEGNCCEGGEKKQGKRKTPNCSKPP